MLTLAQLREKGFQDKRWTPEDKRDQIQDVIKLHNRDKQQTNRKVEELRKRQYAEIRSLSREVREYRDLLDSARAGDKQALRNTLRRHRPTQLAFSDHNVDRAVEHMEQVTFTLAREMDKLRCAKKQRARALLSLKTEVMNLRGEQQVRARQPLHDALEQTLTSQIANCAVKHNAAASVTHTYRKILAILQKDKAYFDAVLGALHVDQVSQCRGVLRATQMGQAAAEDATRLRDEAKTVETELKLSMQQRADAVKALRALVEQNKRVSNSHVRADSTTDLRVAARREDVEAEGTLLRELQHMESLMQRLQATTLVSSYLDVYPRFEEQLRQKQRLLKQVERREQRRDEVLARRNHAKLVLHEMNNTSSEADQAGEVEEQSLRSGMAAQVARRDGAVRARQQLCTQMVSLRTALYSLVLVLNQVKPTQAAVKALPRQFDWDAETDFMDALYATSKRGPVGAPEANAMAMLRTAFIKVGVLVRQLEAESRRGAAGALPHHLIATRAILPDVVAAKRQLADERDQEIGVLVLDSAEAIGDAQVPTRESIKTESAKIIRMAKKLNEAETYDRIKRVRKEEKWI